MVRSLGDGNGQRTKSIVGRVRDIGGHFRISFQERIMPSKIEPMRLWKYPVGHNRLVTENCPLDITFFEKS